MVVPEIGNRNIAITWLWKFMGKDMALEFACMGRKRERMTEEEILETLELASWFDRKVEAMRNE